MCVGANATDVDKASPKNSRELGDVYSRTTSASAVVTRKGWCYLAIVLDPFSRGIGGALETTLSTRLPAHRTRDGSSPTKTATWTASDALARGRDVGECIVADSEFGLAEARVLVTGRRVIPRPVGRRKNP